MIVEKAGSTNNDNTIVTIATKHNSKFCYFSFDQIGSTVEFVM